jgi:hypothetical protein
MAWGMADQLDDDGDEEWFKEVYGTEYTGPPKAPQDTRWEVAPAIKTNNNKRLSANASDSEDEDEPRDPNAVPTDFTSREAKVWEAKAKAVERNWKHRKAQEGRGTYLPSLWWGWAFFSGVSFLSWTLKMEKLSLIVLSPRLGYISFRVLILPLEVGTITVMTRHMISA